jgi:hypothetical protein
VEGSCGHNNKVSGSIKQRKFVDYMKKYQLFKDCVPGSWLAIYNNYTLSVVSSSTLMESLMWNTSQPLEPYGFISVNSS